MRDVIYDEIRLNDYLIIKDIKESILPNIDNVSLKLSNHVGSIFVRQDMGERMIAVEAEFTSDNLEDRQELIDRLAPLLYTQSEKSLVIDNNRKYMAVLDGSTDINNIRYDGSFTLLLIAHNPIAYGDKVELVFNSGDELVNNGNYKTRGLIELKAESPHVVAKLVDGGEYDYVSIVNLSTNDKVVIDLENENITVNDEPFLIHMDPLGDFFDIPSGKFSINLTGTSSGTIKFTERWI